MNYFRSNELSTLCGLEVKKVEDYESGYLTDKVKGTTESLTLPKANLIRFVFDEGFIALRCSILKCTNIFINIFHLIFECQTIISKQILILN